MWIYKSKEKNSFYIIVVSIGPRGGISTHHPFPLQDTLHLTINWIFWEERGKDFPIFLFFRRGNCNTGDGHALFHFTVFIALRAQRKLSLHMMDRRLLQLELVVKP